MTRYAAFLRGINVGGKKTIKMTELKDAVESLGFKNIKTILASGNLLFDAPETNPSILTQRIEHALKERLGLSIGVLIRTMEELQRLWKANPFKGVNLTPETRLYVTFLLEKPQSSLKLPNESSEMDFKILRVTESEVCSVLTLSEKFGTTDLMAILEKEFGRKVTTRNWNTIEKIIE
jgi:uncharacterized protein (DUF1697 family)